MLYTPLLPGAAGGRARAAPRRRAAARAVPPASTCAWAGSPARPRAQHAAGREPRGRGRGPLLRPADRHRRVGQPHAAGPRARRARPRFKSLPEAIALRNHVLRTLEHAETLEDGAARREFLTYVFVGAGYAGLEGLAELQDFVADILDLYPRCRVTGVRWILVEAGPRVMQEIPAKLAAFAEGELRGRGIEIRTRRRSSASPRTTPTCRTASRCRRARSCGRRASSRSRSSRARAAAHRPRADRGDKYMQVPGHDNVWAIGDCAAVPDPARKGEPCPPTAQHAIRQGRVVAHNVAAALGPGGRKRAFKYKTKGVFVEWVAARRSR